MEPMVSSSAQATMLGDIITPTAKARAENVRNRAVGRKMTNKRP